MRKVQIGKGVETRFKLEESAKNFFKEAFTDEDFFSDDELFSDKVIFSDGEEFLGNVTVEGEIVNEGNSLKIIGKIYCRKKFICDRCLEEAEENQVHDFDEEIDAAEIADGFFDITELVRDTLIAAQPIKNLCKEDCRGLCPNCGKNLNDGDCNCEKFSIDPRLSPLLKLLEK